MRTRLEFDGQVVETENGESIMTATRGPDQDESVYIKMLGAAVVRYHLVDWLYGSAVTPAAVHRFLAGKRITEIARGLKEASHHHADHQERAMASLERAWDGKDNALSGYFSRLKSVWCAVGAKTSVLRELLVLRRWLEQHRIELHISPPETSNDA